jgi:hypothetical protein
MNSARKVGGRRVIGSGWALVWRSLLLAMLLGGAVPVRAAPADAYADVLPDLRTAISAETADELSDYVMEATLDPATSTLTDRRGERGRVGGDAGAGG